MLKLDHVGIAVENLDIAVKRFKRLFMIKNCDRWTVPEHGNDTAFLTIFEKHGPKTVENISFEIMAPIEGEQNGEIRDHLNDHGEGIYHLAFLAEDFDRTMGHLKKIPGLDLEPLPPEGSYKHAIIHPCPYTHFVRIYIYNEKYEPNK